MLHPFLHPFLPESFTPDHKPLMGEAPELRGFYLGCGFNSAGEYKGRHFGPPPLPPVGGGAEEAGREGQGFISRCTAPQV